ncbi:hypothetical protein ACTXG6_18810 [Pseudonocardia sp. Cha107L01]|uniref:hypothetical protein n=1 Tax=Pseudonocardia sp. Cha107L01 TaxID=3457576 RepID=UPI00403E3FC1
MRTNPTTPTQHPHAHPATTPTTTTTGADSTPGTDQPTTDTRGVRVAVWALLRTLIGSLALGVVTAGAIALLIGNPHDRVTATAADRAGSEPRVATSPQVRPVAFTTALTASAGLSRTGPVPVSASVAGLVSHQERGGCARTDLDSDSDDQPGLMVQAGPLGVAVGLDDSPRGGCDRSDWSGRAESSSSHDTAKHCGERARDCAQDCTCRDNGPNWAPSGWNDSWGNAPARRSTYPNSYKPGYGPGYGYGVPNGARSGYGPGYPNGYGPPSRYYGPGYPPAADPGATGSCHYYNPGDTGNLPHGGVVCTPTGQ